MHGVLASSLVPAGSAMGAEDIFAAQPQAPVTQLLLLLLEPRSTPQTGVIISTNLETSNLHASAN